LNKCFDSIVKVEFSKDPKDAIEGMWSMEKEYVLWTTPVYARGPVEEWLTQIESRMRSSLYDITKDGLEQYPENGLERDEWLFERAAMTVLTVDQIKWTAGCAEAID
jgi:dynein heavy chain